MIDKPPAFLNELDHSVNLTKVKALNHQQLSWFNKHLKTSFNYIERLSSSYQFPYGFFKAGNCEGEYSHFYKVLPHALYVLEKQASRFEHQLLTQGVKTRDMQVEKMTCSEGVFCICSMAYLNLESFQSSPLQAFQLGMELKKIHKVLQNIDNRELIKYNWQKRLERFRSSFQSFNQLESWPGNVTKEQVKQVQKDFELLEFDLLNAQVTHGDLNSGNVLFTRESEEGVQPIVIDYENSHYAYFPPVFDVGMLMERLFLTKSNSQLLIAEFLKGYGRLNLNGVSLNDAMIAMSTRSRLVLIDKFMHGGNWYQSEWDKFEQLIQTALHSADILKINIRTNAEYETLSSSK